MKSSIITLLAAAALLSSCSQENEVSPAVTSGSADLTFDAVVNDADFTLSKDFTISGTTYNFSTLRYWVSNLKLVKANGEAYSVPNSYYLLEETKEISVQDGSFKYPARKREQIQLTNIPVGEYTSLEFSVGVDSVYNNNLSLQAGELSQLNGMTNISWMWHTSYIFSSLQGSVKQNSTTKTLKVETGLNTNFKSVKLTLPQALKVSSAAASAVISTNVAAITEGVDVMTTPSVGAAQGDVMSKVASNFSSKVFSVKSVN